MGTEIKVSKLPKCDFCTADAEYDGKLRVQSSWANMCKFHWDLYGVAKLGIGFGQKLVKEKKS